VVVEERPTGPRQWVPRWLRFLLWTLAVIAIVYGGYYFTFGVPVLLAERFGWMLGAASLTFILGEGFTAYLVFQPGGPRWRGLAFGTTLMLGIALSEVTATVLPGVLILAAWLTLTPFVAPLTGPDAGRLRPAQAVIRMLVGVALAATLLGAVSLVEHTTRGYYRAYGEPVVATAPADCWIEPECFDAQWAAGGREINGTLNLSADERPTVETAYPAYALGDRAYTVAALAGADTSSASLGRLPGWLLAVGSILLILVGCAHLILRARVY
jgi:hypothetical protein